MVERDSFKGHIGPLSPVGPIVSCDLRFTIHDFNVYRSY